VVLDVMLPGVDGIELLRRMKESAKFREIPVVMATAKGAEYDKIQGLDLGADYYLTKPFGVMELVSCVKAVLRRCAPKPTEHLLKTGGLIVNLDEHTVTADGERVILTYKEFEILRCSSPIRASPLPATNSWRRFGVWITAARHERWICTSGPSGRSWAPTAT
jgi:two-component system alkaline phosphatase synthesis response regulator PhoP